jgi:type IV pilus assembly protein PilC
MKTYKYTAKDEIDRTVTDSIQAESEVQAVTFLKKKGYVILSLDESQNSGAQPKRKRKRVKAAELVIFSRQLATMVDAGLPLVQSLDTLHEQIENPTFKLVVKDLVENIERGASFSEALALHPKVFSNLFVNMVKAGESSGTLSEILDRVAAYLESSAALKRKVKSAMMYPAIVSSMAFGITMLLLLKVIPVFAGIYESFDSALPMPTQVLLTISNLVRRFFLIFLAGGVAGIIVLVQYLKTDNGRLKFDKFKFTLPIFGDLLRKISVSRFTRTLGVLVRSGVPILSALDIVAKTAGNKLVELAVLGAVEEIKKGENISDPLAASKVFPPMVTRMISVGEQSGKLEVMLGKISDFYDDQVNATVSGLTSLIEPLLIGFLGIVIGGIVICMFLPIFRLSTIVSK